MTQASVNEYNNQVEVCLHYYSANAYICYCLECFESNIEKITDENEPLYTYIYHKKLSQFTDADHTEQSNYCFVCSQPLYFIDKQTCQLSSPTLNKWLKRFTIKQRYGLRVGGTRRSTMRKSC